MQNEKMEFICGYCGRAHSVKEHNDMRVVYCMCGNKFEAEDLE